MEKFIFIKKGSRELFYIHDDKLSSIMPGKKEAPRVSNVKFDENAQEWFAELLDGTVIAKGSLRDDVISQEVAEINKRFCTGDYIPGGFHATPVIKSKDGCNLLMADYYRYVGIYKLPSETFYLYIDENCGNYFAIKQCPDGELEGICKSGEKPEVWVASLIEKTSWLIFKEPQTEDELSAMYEAWCRLKTERKIKREENKNAD